MQLSVRIVHATIGLRPLLILEMHADERLSTTTKDKAKDKAGPEVKFVCTSNILKIEKAQSDRRFCHSLFLLLFFSIFLKKENRALVDIDFGLSLSLLFFVSAQCWGDKQFF